MLWKVLHFYWVNVILPACFTLRVACSRRSHSEERCEVKRSSLPSPPLLFIAFFTLHRSPLSERLEQAKRKKTVKTQNTVSFSCQSKQCCINFPHELTCQILTDQSIEIERRAWPTRDHGEKLKATVFPACNSCLNFRIRGHFEFKIFIVWHINTTYFIWI